MPCIHRAGALKQLWHLLYAQLAAELPPADADRIASAQVDSVAVEMGGAQTYLSKRHLLKKRNAEIQALYRDGMPVKDLMERFGLVRSHIRYILNNPL